GQRRLGTALRLAGASVVGPAVFSLFLLSRGLPALPNSVLVKAQAYSLSGGKPLDVIRAMYWNPDSGKFFEYAWWAMLAVTVLLAVMAVRQKQQVRRAVL